MSLTTPSRSLPLRTAALLALLATAVLTGCGAIGMIGGISRDTSETTVVPNAVFEIVADKNLNPDSHGVPKPVQLRLYQLRAKSSFERVSFFELQDKDNAALGADFVHRDELLILPGEKRTLVIKGNPDVKLFGVLVAYRDLDKSTWRTSTDAPNSLELRKSWWGYGSVEKPQPIDYLLKLAPSRVQLDLKPQGK